MDAGLATRRRARATGRGRPAWHYRPRPPEQSPVREYAGLAAVLAAQIARSSSDPHADALAAGEKWGRALLGDQDPAPTPREARERVLTLLAEIGFAPEADGEAVGTWVRETQGDFLAAYQAHTHERWGFREEVFDALVIEQNLREFVYAARHLPRWGYVPAANLRAAYA